MLHLRYFLRTLVRQPGFALTVILSLALGIGANSVMFAVAKTILLDRLAVRDPESLVLLEWQTKEVPADSLSGNMSFENGNVRSTSFSHPGYEYLSRNAKTLSSLIAFSGIDRLNVSVAGDATIARGAMVSGNYYSALGVNAALGRTLTPADGEDVAMISYSYWRERFGGAGGAVGRVISVNGKPVTIVGVEPRNFEGTLDVGAAPHVIQPIAGKEVPNDRYWWLCILGRRAPNATNAGIAAEMSVLMKQHADEDVRVTALPGARGLFDLRSTLREPVMTLMGAVVLVLLLACANVAGLSLARAMARRKEIAVRMSLGATRGALIRQLLMEGVLLSLLGGVAGVALAYWMRPLIPAILPAQGLPADIAVRVDTGVLLFTTLVAVVTGIVFSLVPALRATRVEIAQDTRLPGRNRFASALTVVQIALSIVMMIGCGLFLRSLVNLNSQEPGFDPAHVLVFTLDPTLNGYEGERLASFYDRVDETIRALPGVESAAITQQTLLSGMSSIMTVYVEGREPKSEREFVKKHTVGTDYLQTMRIPVVAGRGITEADREGTPPIALVSQQFVREFFPNQNPIGKRISAAKERPGELEIVGVVRDSLYTSVREGMPATVYVPFAQNRDRVSRMSFAVRGRGDAEGLTGELTGEVREAVRRIDPNVPVFGIAAQTTQIASSLSQERAMARLSTFFGLMALVLSCVGLYGLMSYIANGRTRETGVRIALGATGSDIAMDVLRRSLLLVVAGVALGVAAALALTRFVASMIFGIEPNDPLSIALAVSAMVIVALAAASVPARRASRVDPIVALRAE